MESNLYLNLPNIIQKSSNSNIKILEQKYSYGWDGDGNLSAMMPSPISNLSEEIKERFKILSLPNWVGVKLRTMDQISKITCEDFQNLQENSYKLFHKNKSQLESGILSYSNLIGMDYFSGFEPLKSLRFVELKFCKEEIEGI